MFNLKKFVIILILIIGVILLYNNRENFGTGDYHYARMKGIREHQKRFLESGVKNIIPSYTQNYDKKEKFTVKGEGDLNDGDLDKSFEQSKDLTTNIEYPTLLSNYNDEHSIRNYGNKNFQENMLESLSFVKPMIGTDESYYLNTDLEMSNINDNNVNDNLRKTFEAKEYTEDIKDEYLKSMTELRNRGGNTTLKKC